MEIYLCSRRLDIVLFVKISMCQYKNNTIDQLSLVSVDALAIQYLLRQRWLLFLVWMSWYHSIFAYGIWQGNSYDKNEWIQLTGIVYFTKKMFRL